MKPRHKNSMLIGSGVVVFLVVMVIIIGVVSHRKAARVVTSSEQGQTPYHGITANMKNDIEYQIQGVKKNQNQLSQHALSQLAQLQQEISQLKKQQNKKRLKSQSSTDDNTAQYNANGDLIAGHNGKSEETDKLTQKIQQMSDSLKQEINSMKANTSQAISAIQTKLDSGIAVGNGNDTSQSTTPTYVWVQDLSTMQTNGGDTANANTNDQTGNPLKKSLNLFGDEVKANSIYDDQGHLKSRDITSTDKKITVKPAFSVPNPAIMTNAIALTPIVGRIPKGQNHTVWSPYKVVFVVEHPNLVSNGHQLAPQMGKMMGIATCSGVYGSILQRTGFNRCKVDTLTYIFPDGTIATESDHDEQGSKDSNNSHNQNGIADDGLGYITDAYGNPQIGGTLETSIGLRVAMTGATAGVSAYGGALASANTMVSSGTGSSIIQQVTDANKYALGQGLNASAQGVNKEWADISANLFDFVFTPKWNATTHQMKRFNIVITHELHFDYDTKGRKLDYGVENANTTDHLIF